MIKKGILMALSICLLFTVGCSDDENKVDGILDNVEERQDIGISDEWDSENYITSVQYCGENTEGFYYYDGRQLYFLNKQSGNMMPLCTKVQCDHVYYSDELSYLNTCDSIFSVSNCVQIYNGYLYIDVESDTTIQTLYKMKADGTEREVVVENIFERFADRMEKLEASGEENISTVGGSLSWEIVNDKVYVCSCVGGEEENLEFYVDVYDVNNGEKVDELVSHELSGNSGMIIGMNIVNDSLKVCLYVSSLEANKNGDFIDSKIFYNVDLKNGQLCELVKDTVVSTYAFSEGKMLYREKGGDIFSIDEDGNEVKCIELTDVEKQFTVSINCFGDYIFVTPNIKEQKVLDEYGYYTKVYDKEYNWIDTVKLPDNLLPIAGHNQVLLNVRGGEEMYYFDPAQLATGNVEVKKYAIE